MSLINLLLEGKRLEDLPSEEPIMDVKIGGWEGIGSFAGWKRYTNEDTESLPSILPKSCTEFELINTHVKSLKGSPENVDGRVIIRGNINLHSLEGGPKTIGGSYFASENRLVTLKGAPKLIHGGSFSCHMNSTLEDIEGGPEEVKGDVKLNMNRSLKTLAGIGTKWFKKVGGTLNVGKQVEEHALGLVLMDCRHFTLLFPGSEIIIEYAGKQTKEEREDAVIECQHALIDAGFERLAKL